MRKPNNLQQYWRRLMPVVQQLWQDPSRSYSVEQLAALAHFSPCHFHRIYRQLMGETVAATQQRLRLHLASYHLMQSAQQPLLQVAQRSGYRSSAAFVRAFAAAYGVTPALYRKQRLQTLASTNNTKDNHMYSVTIMQQPVDIQLAARRHHGSYLYLDTAFSQLEMVLPDLPVPPDARWFGLFYDDPADVSQGIVGPQTYADACVEISCSTALPDAVLPDGVALRHIEAGRYAVLEHVGAYSELDQAYQWLIGHWLPQSGELPKPVPGIEWYLNDASNTAPKDLRTQIWLALAD